MPTAIQTIMRNKYGGDVVVKHYRAVAIADRSKIIDNNPERVSLTIINNSSVRGAIALKQAFEDEEYIFIEANGGSIMFDAENDGDMTTLAIYQKLVSSGLYLHVIEVVRVNTTEDGL